MLRRLFSAVGFAASAPTAAAAPPYSPYTSEAANSIYNLLFCDDPMAFAAQPGQQATSWQFALASIPIEVDALQALAGDAAQEGRIRYLAYQRLRGAGQAVAGKQLLGVVVEIPLGRGLDTLAAHSEGGVRYINQIGKLVVIEGISSFLPLVERLFAAGQPVVYNIGPWDKPRREPPRRGSVRMTFLVSDGLYFGEGPMSVMQKEAMAGPIIQRSVELLQAVVSADTQ